MLTCLKEKITEKFNVPRLRRSLLTNINPRVKLLMHFTYPAAKGLYPLPVGEIDDCLGVGGTVGHEHDQANHEAVEKAVTRVVQLAGKNTGQFWCPGNLLQKFDQVGVSFRLILFRLSRHDVHREERVRLTFQQCLMALDELFHQRLVIAITDTGADDDLVKGGQVQPVGLGKRCHRRGMPLLLHDLAQALTNTRCMTVGGRINDKNAAHPLAPVKYPQQSLGLVVVDPSLGEKMHYPSTC